jgi:cardiolipin synthase
MLRGRQKGIRPVAAGANGALIRSCRAQSEFKIESTMPPRTTKAQLMWTVAVTIIATLIVVVIVINSHTPEKKVQHQVRHLYAVVDPQFEREMGALLGPAILADKTITALQNGDETFPAMLKAIRAAESTINFETYIYWLGRTGEEFAQARIERARVGVKVHLMLDWLGSEKMAPQLLTQMKDAGVEIERYHALHWYSL